VLLYRVAPVDPAARPTGPGHPLFVDPAWQGGGRWDNPSHYTLLYLSEHADGAVAETFQGFDRWTPAMFRHPAAGADRQLITYDLPTAARVTDLDDARFLADQHIRPSRVASKNTVTTQGIALRLHTDLGATTVGLRWWSSLDADWIAYALWDRRRLTLERVEPLTITHPAVTAAARRLGRSLK
jgi:hypothetical protein